MRLDRLGHAAALLIAVVLGAAASGCNGDSEAGPAQAAPRASPARFSDARLIRAWADDLRLGGRPPGRASGPRVPPLLRSGDRAERAPADRAQDAARRGRVQRFAS